MQILVNGNPEDTLKSRKFYCNCGCIFIADSNEYLIRPMSKEAICECPECREDVTMSIPINHAKWVGHSRAIIDPDGASRRYERGYMCSECGFFSHYFTNLCPNCKSLMERDK